MNLVLYIKEFFLSIIESLRNYLSLDKIIHSISAFSALIQDLWWIVVLLFTIISIIIAVFSIPTKTNKFTKLQINNLNKTGKYIPAAACT